MKLQLTRQVLCLCVSRCVFRLDSYPGSLGCPQRPHCLAASCFGQNPEGGWEGHLAPGDSFSFFCLLWAIKGRGQRVEQERQEEAGRNGERVPSFPCALSLGEKKRGSQQGKKVTAVMSDVCTSLS